MLSEDGSIELAKDFRQLAEHINDALRLTDWVNQKVIYVNPGYEKIWGRIPESLIEDGWSWSYNIHSDDRERVVRSFQENAPLGKFDEVYRIIRDDGQIRWVHDRAFPIHDEEGRVYRMVSLSQDITSFKNIEEELIRSRKHPEKILKETNNDFEFADTRLGGAEASQRMILEGGGDPVIITDLNDIVKGANHATEDLFGYKSSELLGRTFSGLEGIDKDKFKGWVEDCRTGKEISSYETAKQVKDGRCIPLSIRVSPVRNSGGELTHLSFLYRGFTEPDETENVLKESAQDYETLSDNLPVGVFRVDPRGKILSVNPSLVRMLGYASEKELLAVPGMSLHVSRESYERVTTPLKSLGNITDYEIQLPRKDGSLIWVSLSVKAVMDEDGNVSCFDGVVIDISERKRAEEMWRRSEELNRAITDSSPIGVSVRSRYGRLQGYNKSWQRIWNTSNEDILVDIEKERSELVFDERDDYLGEWLPEVRKIYEQGGTLHIPEIEVKNGRRGSARWVSCYFYSIDNIQGEVEKVVILTEDITERKRVQEQILRNQRELKVIFAGVDALLWSVREGPNGELYYEQVNDSFAAVEGHTPEFYCGKPISRLHPPEECAKIKNSFEWAKLGKIHSYEAQFGEGETRRYFNIRIIPLAEEDGCIRRFIGSATDITSLKKVQVELQMINDELEIRIGRRTAELQKAHDELEEKVKERTQELLEANKALLREISERKRAEVLRQVKAQLLDSLRQAKSIKECLLLGCEAIRDAGLYARAVFTTKNERGETTHFAHVGLDEKLVEELTRRPPAPKGIVDRMLDPKFKISHSYFIPREAEVNLDETGRYVIQEADSGEGPNAWKRGDELFVPMLRMDGSIGSFLTVDTPMSGTRPDMETILYLEDIADIVARQIHEMENFDALRNSEERYRAITDNALVGVYIYHTGRFLFVNPAMEQITGYSRDELMSMDTKQLEVPDHLKTPEIWKETRQQEDETVSEYSMHLCRKDGKIAILEFKTHPIIYEGKKAILGNCMDITERKLAEEEVQRHSEGLKAVNELAIELATAPQETDLFALAAEKLRRITNALAVGVTSYDPLTMELVTRYVAIDNPLLAKVNKLLGHSILKMRVPVSPDLLKRMLSEVVAVSEDFRRTTFGAVPKPVSNAIQKILSIEKFVGLALQHGGKLVGTVVIVIQKGRPAFASDVLHAFAGVVASALLRKKAEDALRESEEKYRSFVERANDGIAIIQDLKLQYVNPRLAALLGYGPEDMIGTTATDYVYPNEVSHLLKLHKSRMEGEDVASVYETALRSKDGRRIYVEVNAGKINYQGLPAALVLYRDITERKLAETALKESEERFRGMYENSTLGLYRTTPDGRILMANPALLRMLGYSSFEELAERNLEKNGYEPSYPRSQFKMLVEMSGEVKALESAWLRRDGKTIYVMESARVVRDTEGNPLYYEGTVEDISERKLAEDALRRERQAFGIIAEAAVNAKDVSDLCYMVLKGLRETLGFDVGFIQLYDSEKRLLYLKAETNKDGSKVIDHDTKPQSIDNPNYVGAYVARTGKPIIASDVRLHPIYRTYRERLEAHNVRALISWPITGKGGKVLGIIQFLNKEPQDIPLENRSFFDTVAGMYATVLERRLAEGALSESEERFRSLVENLRESFIIYDRGENRVTYHSPATQKLLGISHEMIVGVGLDELVNTLVHENDRKEIIAALRTALEWRKTGFTESLNLEFRIKKPEGEVRWIDMVSYPLPGDGQISSLSYIILFDVTERKLAEEKIKTSLCEKDVLLKEIHHRVKNNLQIISSLFKLQSDSVGEDSRAIELFRVARDRIKSIALVHEKLYKSSNLSEVDFASYIKSLVNSLYLSYSVDPKNVKLSLDVSDISLDINKAIPCGLIINELVTNSLKHAFPSGRKGEINVGLTRTHGKLHLVVSDNGVGLPKGFDLIYNDTLGMELIHTLTAQLRGELRFESENGTTFRVTFPILDQEESADT